MRGALEEHHATASGPDGELDVRVSKSGNDIVVHGTLKAELEAPCARCLEPCHIVINQPISALLVPAAAVRAEPGEYEFGAEEAETLTYEGETLSLDEIVRDELVLETPMIPLCREDCPGISPPPPERASGEGPESAEKPLDPRLAPLLQFKARVTKAPKTNKE